MKKKIPSSDVREINGDPLGPLPPGVDAKCEGSFPGPENILVSFLRASECAFLLIIGEHAEEWGF